MFVFVLLCVYFVFYVCSSFFLCACVLLSFDCLVVFVLSFVSAVLNDVFFSLCFVWGVFVRVLCFVVVCYWHLLSLIV